MSTFRLSVVRCLTGAGVLATLTLAACGPAETSKTAAGKPQLAQVSKSELSAKGAPVNMRRLTEDQYRSVIADIFGDSITVAGHFDPILRTNGLLAVGASRMNMTPSAFERNEGLARTIAAQVMHPLRREVLMPCKPASATATDDACAQQFFKNIGRLLYRRPLTADEVATRVRIANDSTAKLGDFYAGLERSLAGMMMAPNFMYIVSRAEPDPANPGANRLDAFSKASRLSFFLWNTTPDEELLKAAERGDLNSKDGLKRQVDRMLASPRLKEGVRAFFRDMFAFEDFDTLTKDNVIYPAFNQFVANDAKEQTLRTTVDLLVTRRGDYRDLFTTRNTFLSPSLGIVYRVPVNKPDGGWVPHELPEGDPRAGIVSQISFVALHSHPGQSSATLRGRAVREIFLCQKVPDPPANIEFELFNDPNSPNKTARERLSAHATNPACAGCHKLVDPIGLTLENFDGLGQFRTTENGAPLDTSGALDGVKFDGAIGLGRALHGNPGTTKCLVNRLYAYATGAAPGTINKEWLSYLEQGFAADGYRVPDLMRRIVTSDAFFSVAPEKEVKSATDGAPRKENRS